MDVTIAASILSADFGHLADQVIEAQAAGVSWVQVDVMDGRFVPNISVGPMVVGSVRPVFSGMLDAHLMIEEPERYVADFREAGADLITVHVEATRHLHRVVQHIKELGAQAGVALNPATSLSAVEEILPDVDLVLIMSVNPGFGGQGYIPGSTDKIARLRRMLDARGLGHIHLQVDGGIKASNIAEVVDAGATCLIVGSGLYNDKASVADSFAALRAALDGRAR
jgi:ribulose-phosphate 3-epimerase